MGMGRWLVMEAVSRLEQEVGRVLEQYERNVLVG